MIPELIHVGGGSGIWGKMEHAQVILPDTHLGGAEVARGPERSGTRRATRVWSTNTSNINSNCPVSGLAVRWAPCEPAENPWSFGKGPYSLEGTPSVEAKVVLSQVLSDSVSAGRMSSYWTRGRRPIQKDHHCRGLESYRCCHLHTTSVLVPLTPPHSTADSPGLIPSQALCSPTGAFYPAQFGQFAGFSSPKL